ncbi:MAG TPA: hypothetical protein VFJ06_06020 [Halococcus sp.]|nr:hypothetical protein [Halococcus sp.]
MTAELAEVLSTLRVELKDEVQRSVTVLPSKDRDSERVGDAGEALYLGSVRRKANTPADEIHCSGALAATVTLI